MLESFAVTGQQIVILFIIICVGFICGRTKLLKEEGVKGITDLVLYAVTPCVIIDAFQREYDSSMLKGLIVSAVIAALSHLFFIIAANLFIKDRDKKRQSVLRFGIIFSNCGYMSLPMQSALLGSEGVFYATAYIAVFNIFMWTYGLVLISNDKNSLSAKKIILNPGIVGTCIGLILFLTPVTLPSVISYPIEYLAVLNTPLPMIIIGFYLSKLGREKIIKQSNEVIAVLLRLVILPLIVLTVMYAVGIRGILLVSGAISVSAPVATATTMFASRFGGDVELSVKLVSVSTILSIISMTLIVGIAQFLQ